jgi:hypothetical protein
LKATDRRSRHALAGALAAVALMTLAPVVSATTGPIGVFKLLGTYANSKATSLELHPIESPVFQVVNLAGNSRPVAAFDAGEGFGMWNPQSSAARNTYTIEVWFELDDVGPSFRRILGFGPLDWDGGLYFDNGKLALFPYKATTAAVANDNQWLKLRVTRSDATKVMNVYVNGVRKIRYVDSLSEFTLRLGQAYFFLDDTAGSENPSGSVARIRVWDRVVAP